MIICATLKPTCASVVSASPRLSTHHLFGMFSPDIYFDRPRNAANNGSARLKARPYELDTFDTIRHFDTFFVERLSNGQRRWSAQNSFSLSSCYTTGLRSPVVLNGRWLKRKAKRFGLERKTTFQTYGNIRQAGDLPHF
jgi:hypothetical protein